MKEFIEILRMVFGVKVKRDWGEKLKLKNFKKNIKKHLENKIEILYLCSRFCNEQRPSGLSFKAMRDKD